MLIATRSSQLALWQANEVKYALEALGVACELLPTESTGDLQLTQPVYAMGISGVFTKELDSALLDGRADLAVHSLKDVPTKLAEGLTLAATLARGAHEDVLLLKDPSRLSGGQPFTVASSSLRRIAQWLEQYPAHNTVPIRGNVQTRLRKFRENEFIDGIIFAKAGLERLGLLPAGAVLLDWMLPAPAQGTVGLVCRKGDTAAAQLCAAIGNKQSFISSHIERQFLGALMGGCSVPISALAQAVGDQLFFAGAMHSFSGRRCYRVNRIFECDNWENAGAEAALEILGQPGAGHLLDEIRSKNHAHEGTVG